MVPVKFGNLVVVRSQYGPVRPYWAVQGFHTKILTLEIMFRCSSIISVNYSLSSSKKLVYGWWGRRCIVPALVSPTNLFLPRQWCLWQGHQGGEMDWPPSGGQTSKVSCSLMNFRLDVLINSIIQIILNDHVYGSELKNSKNCKF